MVGAGCVNNKDFGGCGINVTDWGGGSHVIITGAKVYDGGVRYLVGGFGWRRGWTASRISRRNNFFNFIVTITCYTCGPA